MANRMTTTPGVMTTMVIYDHPADYPDSFVLRAFDMDSTGAVWHRPGDDLLGDVLEDVRTAIKFLRPGAVCFGRAPADDPYIVETWL